MEIKCAGCKSQIKSSREDFVCVFYSCKFDGDSDVKKHITDPCRSETDKVFGVIKTGSCCDFEENEVVEEKAVAQESEID